MQSLAHSLVFANALQLTPSTGQSVPVATAAASSSRDVPEPAVLLLLGLGLFVAGRRIRHLKLKSRSAD